MARPRVFVSSTFYDLKHVRNDLENFISNLGYDTIMNDKGQIPYSAAQPLQDSCYDEASRADILVGIIGGRYGSDSGDDLYSVSMREIKTAIRNNKQVFIFVEKSVLSENLVYQLNKDSTDIKYPHVDSVKIHKFIEEIQGLPINNALIPFESATDITSFLKEQFAGLFQRLLQDKSTLTEQTTLYDLNETIQELKTISDSIRDENEVFISKFKGSIFAVNSIVNKITKLLGIEKWVAFANNKGALYELLNLLGFYIVESDDDDYDFLGTDDVLKKSTDEYVKVLTIKHEIFDSDDSIKDIRKPDLIDQLIKYEERAVQNYKEFAELDMDDSELPF